MSIQPADLFITLLRKLEQDLKAAQATAEWYEANPDPSRRHIHRLMTLLNGSDPAKSLADWVLSSDDRPVIDRALLAAQAVDAWYAPFAAYHDPSEVRDASAITDGHVEARRRYNRYGRFNTDAADGQVIIRPGLLGRSMNIRETTPLAPFDITDLFQNLFLIPPTLPVGPRHDGGAGGEDGHRLAVAYHRIAEVPDHNPGDPDWTPVIGVVPLAEAETDIAMRLFSRDGEDWYDPTPQDLGRAATEAIDALAAQGASIILFPEASVHPDTLVTIKTVLRRHAVDGPIRYVLAGIKQDVGQAQASGTEPFNRLAVLDRTGKEIAGQAKLHRRDLDSHQCRFYDLRSQDGRLLDGAKEYIKPGDRFTIIELPNMGRLAITIGEDPGRAQPGAWISRGMMIDWLVTPVMDSGLTTERWRARAAARSSRAGYCRVVVANSMTLSHRFNCFYQTNSQYSAIIRDCGVALLFQPRANPNSAPRVALLTLDLDDPAPGYACARWEPERWLELTKPASPDGAP